MPKDVLITPGSGLIDFKDAAGGSDATIQLDDLGNLNITNSAGVLSIGNTAANVYIGDGTNSVDIIFEQSGKIRALTGKTLTLGQSDSSIAVASPLTLNSALTAGTSSFSGVMTLPTGAGTNYIKPGTGDGASFTTYNLKINSWWGIGFGDYQDLSTVKLYLDCRTGNVGSSGQFVSTVATGTAPLTVSSTTTVTNLSADMLDGSHRDTAYNSFGNGTIPIRHSSGYLYSNYFNTTADVTTTAPSHIAIQTSSDNFIRWQTPAQFKSNLAITLQDLPDAWVKRSVKAATTANITLSAPQTIDGISVVAGDRVLVKNQTAGAENGIYVVAAGAWTRATDADTSAEIAGGQVAVDQGTSNGGSTWDNDFKSTDTLGTTAMPWNLIIDSGRLVTSGSTVTPAAVLYNGTTAAAGRFDGGTTTPTGTTRLNYGGYFYPTFINLAGSGDTATAATHYFVETGSDGFVRPKTLANVQSEVVTSAVLGSGTADSTKFLRGDRTWAVPAGVTWSKKTANYTAVNGDSLIADTSGGAFTITLPATPSIGNSVTIADGQAWGTNNLTIARNGSTIEGVADDITVDITGLSLNLVYDGATWEVFASGGASAVARGGGSDQVFFENGTSVNSSYSITTGMNAMSAGPITILSPAVVTVPSGSTWTIV